MFTLYSRAKSTFQDPNVFGPFLILPFVLLAQHILTHRLRHSLLELALSLIIMLAIFLSFSRAAWGLTVFAVLFTAVLGFLNEQSARGRLRLVGYVLGGVVVVALLLAVALSFDAVSSLFAERAELVQDYDGGRLGRFERHIIGFFMVLEKPLGLGPYAFGLTLGADEHNMLLKGFTVYGWLGGFAYLLLIGATLLATTPLLRKRRPWQPILVATYSVYLGHLMIHLVIDQDHWRHLFLIYGMLWGMVAAEKRAQRAETPRQFAPQRSPQVFAVAALPRSGQVLAGRT
jgi:O-antigen ligase